MADFYCGSGNDMAYIVEGYSTVLSWFSFGYSKGASVGPENGAIRFVNVTIPRGTTVQSAVIHFRCEDAVPDNNQSVKVKIYGMAEDNTGDLTVDPWGRVKTSANYANTYGDSRDNTWIDITVTDIVNEIVGRSGWSSGNAMGFVFEDDGTATDQTRDLNDDYGNTYDTYLTITLSSPSVSPSRSISFSPSRSASPTPSPSPSPIDLFRGLKIAKSGINVLKTQEPYDLIFSSSYGTLKYYTKQTITTSFDASTADIACTGSYSHNLGYYPYCEVFVDVYTGSTPSGTYQYCPFNGAGATVFYSANYKITTTQVVCYGQINGSSTATWHFDFLVFVFKNNLSLS